MIGKYWKSPENVEKLGTAKGDFEGESATFVAKHGCNFYSLPVPIWQIFKNLYNSQYTSSGILCYLCATFAENLHNLLASLVARCHPLFFQI